MLASAKTELLVDADNHSIEQIRQAMSLLKDEGQEVAATIFAPPRRMENKQWRAFLQENEISFEPVMRRVDIHSEPNDEAVQRALRSLSTRDDVACIALLTRDTDFIDVVVELQALGTCIVVLIPDTLGSVLQKYDAANVNILKLQPARLCKSRVRAVLDHKGGGSVHFAEPYNQQVESDAQYNCVESGLQKFGFIREGGYMIPAIAKFWFVNHLGSLTVFPGQLARIAAYEVMQAKGDVCQSCDPTLDMAFFLPLSAAGKGRKAVLQEFGSRLCHQVFKGGGPFLLQDSPDLTAQALRRLGYLDDDFNADFSEALFCFLNANINKGTLRKLGCLPSSGARSPDVSKMLRTAFLSDQCSGRWQCMRREEASMEPILVLLRKAKVLGKTDYIPDEVFEAMKMYCEQYRLPTMRTFNGLAARILQSVERGPDRRLLVEVGK